MLPPGTPICVDGRLLQGGGTGVAGYARALLEAAPLTGGRPCVLAAG